MDKIFNFAKQQMSTYSDRFGAVNPMQQDITQFGCTVGCAGTCAGGCWAGCIGNCKGDCMGNCKGDCMGSCRSQAAMGLGY